MAASANSQLLPFNDLLGHQFRYSRRLLFLNNSNLNSTKNSTEPSILGDGYTLDANIIMIMSILVCALFCSLGLNSLIRCALRINNINVTSSDPQSARVAANKGVKKKALKTFPIVTYSSELTLPSLDSDCAICLSEFNNGDRLRILPKCNHGFHVRCIDKWLGSHSSCPKCRHCLIETCHKIVGSAGGTRSTSSQPSSTVAPVETIVRIVPLEPEGMVRNYS